MKCCIGWQYVVPLLSLLRFQRDQFIEVLQKPSQVIKKEGLLKRLLHQPVSNVH